ncbi:MAG: gluconate 2-dehydrogenase subunit 3 family protein [Chroococcidiopsidaceae cyanobacterium CP_BM_RX_35]|nr:gluconate 2-dehydrogenase subunit 3 family protein [Chroococcidiopsidaceae cyanobacterium CP_BM_RX_35]
MTIAALPSFAFEDDEKEDASDSVLNRHERVSLSALGETLLPGASKAGIVPYVQHQLKSETPLLFLRYMDYSDDCLAFYKKGLQALEAFSLSRFGAAFPDLSDEQQSDLVSSLSKASPPDWDGPPSPLFYFVVRNDAIDVVYGTEEGFRKLDVPYLALISPPKKW